MAVQQGCNWQDNFLNQLRKQKQEMTIYLMNGFQIKHAIIDTFDHYVIIVHTEGKEMMIYKHAISSITPSEPLLYKECTEQGE